MDIPGIFWDLLRKDIDLMGEIVIYSFSAATVIFEVNRRDREAKRKAKAKEIVREKKKAEREKVLHKIQDEIQNVQKQIDELRIEIKSTKLKAG